MKLKWIGGGVGLLVLGISLSWLRTPGESLEHVMDEPGPSREITYKKWQGYWQAGHPIHSVFRILGTDWGVHESVFMLSNDETSPPWGFCSTKTLLYFGNFRGEWPISARCIIAIAGLVVMAAVGGLWCAWLFIQKRRARIPATLA